MLAHKLRRAAGAVDAGGCSCTPAYVTGNRTGSITVTASSGLLGGGTASNFVDGAFGLDTTDSTFFNTVAAAGRWVQFQFGASTKITEAKWYQNSTEPHGTWKWQGSDDASGWTDIGVGFQLGGVATQTQTQLSGNTVGYIYYRLLGVSGNANGTPWLHEIEFKQCTC